MRDLSIVRYRWWLLFSDRRQPRLYFEGREGTNDASRQDEYRGSVIIQTRQPHLRRVVPYCATRSWDRYAWTLMGRRISPSLTRRCPGMVKRKRRALSKGGGHVKGINRRSFHHHPPPVPADVSWTDGHAANAMKGRGKHLHNC